MRSPIALARTIPAQSLFASLAMLAALALLALVLAYWTWAWLAPRQEPRSAAVAAVAPRLEQAGRLFGGAPSAQAAPTGLAIELLGVAAESGDSPGYAVLRLEAKRAVAVREGSDIEPGIKLVEVHPHHVVLERGGVRETLAFPEKKK